MYHRPYAFHVYVSPHLDDVILSCGGSIVQQVQRGDMVTVITVCAGSPDPIDELSPFARELHQRWQRSAGDSLDFSDPPAVRREEDRRAFAGINPTIQIVHLPLTDCIYRRDTETGQFLYQSEESLFGAVHPADPAWTYLSDSPLDLSMAMVYLPLAVGNHVDHQIVRRAAEQWKIEDQNRWYYEDYPYAGEPGAVESILGKRSEWESELIQLDEAEIRAKVKACTEHRSQISSFWQDTKSMEKAIRDFTAAQGGERFWRKKGS